MNKLGYECYFASPESYLEIDFANLLKTCSHELAHYIQFVKYGESSCESDVRTDKYIVNMRVRTQDRAVEELAKENKEISGEIYQIIKKDCSEWETRWNKNHIY